MAEVFDRSGTLVADIPVSDNTMALMERGVDAVIRYHTPQLLRGQIGQQEGSFTLSLKDGKLVTLSVEAVKAYAAMQAAVNAQG